MAKPASPPPNPESPVAKKGQPPSAKDLPGNLKQPQSGEMKPLNFKVDAAFHREFKTYAASHGVTMLELLQEGFALIKRQRGK